MDGNRRYGRSKYGSVTKGHWDGSKTLVDFAKWSLAEGVQIVTVYAFSTENWNRSASEVSALMGIFCKYCDELRVAALEKGIRVQVLSTETDQVSFCYTSSHYCTTYCTPTYGWTRNLTTAFLFRYRLVWPSEYKKWWKKQSIATR